MRQIQNTAQFPFFGIVLTFARYRLYYQLYFEDSYACPYVRKLVKKASEHLETVFFICGPCRSPYCGLDCLIDYREYPNGFSSLDQDKVAENQHRLNEIPPRTDMENLEETEIAHSTAYTGKGHGPPGKERESLSSVLRGGHPGRMTVPTPRFFHSAG